MVSFTLTNEQLRHMVKQWSDNNDKRADGLFKFLISFGPSGSPMADDFFRWVKDVHHGVITAESWDTTYDIVFDNDIAATAFILRF